MDLSYTGKTKRMNSIMPEGFIIMNPRDHDMSVYKEGLTYEKTLRDINNPFITAFLWHKGMAAKLIPHVKYAGVLVHASAGLDWSEDPLDKTIVCEPYEALAMGADGYSVHINTHAPTVDKQMEDIGWVTGEASQLGMPLLIMTYARGGSLESRYIEKEQKKIKNMSKEEIVKKSRFHPEHVMHAVGAAKNLGADIIKTTYTGDKKSFRGVVDAAKPVPVIIAGGPKAENELEVLKMLYDAMQAGAKGCSFGRNIFQNKDPLRFTGAIHLICKENEKPERAWEIAKDTKRLIRKVMRDREIQLFKDVAPLIKRD